MMLRLRPASAADEDMVFRWRNEPFLVARASSRRTVTREEHSRWFRETIAGGERRMFIIEVEGAAAGQVRFDRRGSDEWVISVYLMEPFTGRGLGVEAIRSGCNEMVRAWNVTRVIACVRHDNPPGRSAFLKAGFRDAEGGGYCPAEHYTMVWTAGA